MGISSSSFTCHQHFRRRLLWSSLEVSSPQHCWSAFIALQFLQLNLLLLHTKQKLITKHTNLTDQEGTSVVAVKTLKESAGDKERQELLKELQVMKSLKPHQNLVQLLGCCTDKGYFLSHSKTYE